MSKTRSILWTAVLAAGAMGFLLVGAAEADIVQADDVIDLFSLCVGNDCVNGEVFGFDTVRLKENNLRIHFDDTSNSASFPTNNWRITINDSTNGGANYFSIDDADAGRQIFRVAAGASSNSLTVDANGDVGINTLNAVVELHIVDGDTPTVRLEQDGSSGFTPQIWDVAGNETNFFVRDATNGSTLPFRIEPATGSNTLYLDSAERVGINTTSPDADLHVVHGGDGVLIDETDGGAAAQAAMHIRGTTGNADFRVENTSAATAWAVANGSAGNFAINLIGSGANEVTIRAMGDPGGNATMEVAGSIMATNVAFPSSRELKTDFAPVDTTQVLEKVAGLEISTWKFKESRNDTRNIGPIAEDFHEAFGLGDGKHLSVVDSNGVALAAIQGLNAKVEERNARIEALQQANEELARRLADLEARLESGDTR